MYNTGNAGFLSAACSPNRVIDATAILHLPTTAISLGTTDLVSYKVTNSSTAGKAFVPGSFVAGQLELSLITGSPEVSKINFKNTIISKILVNAGIKVNTALVNIPMGVFYPEANGVNTSNDGQVTIKATNLPPVLSSQFNSSSLPLPCTVGEALSQISAEIGIPISVVEGDFPNLGVELIESFVLTTTYREAIAYCAEAIGAFVHMGRDGVIQLKKVFSGLVNIGCVLDDNYLYSVSKQESSVKPFQFIGIKATKDDLGVTQETGSNTERRYDIINNPLTYGHPEDFLSGLVSPTTFTEFYPSKVSFHGRPDLDAGDVLEYVYKGVTYILPICSHVFEYNGGFNTTIESIGSDKVNTSSGDSGFKTQITALKQSVNSLMRDLEKTQSDIVSIDSNIANISTLLQTANELSSKITNLENDIETFSKVTQTAEQLKIDFGTLENNLKETNDTISDNQKTLLSYFDFQEDGLVIGANSSNLKLKLSNNKIQFLKDDTTEVAYLSEGKLYITDGHFLTSLVLGNFEFVPRSNGNLSLRRRA